SLEDTAAEAAHPVPSAVQPPCAAVLTLLFLLLFVFDDADAAVPLKNRIFDRLKRSDTFGAGPGHDVVIGNGSPLNRFLLPLPIFEKHQYFAVYHRGGVICF